MKYMIKYRTYIFWFPVCLPTLNIYLLLASDYKTIYINDLQYASNVYTGLFETSINMKIIILIHWNNSSPSKSFTQKLHSQLSTITLSTWHFILHSTVGVAEEAIFEALFLYIKSICFWYHLHLLIPDARVSQTISTRLIYYYVTAN